MSAIHSPSAKLIRVCPFIARFSRVHHLFAREILKQLSAHQMIMEWLSSHLSRHQDSTGAAEERDRVDDALRSQLIVTKAKMLMVLHRLDIASPRLERCIRHAPDMLTLWYLRAEVANLVARRAGEAAAQHCLVEMTPLFRDEPCRSRLSAARLHAD